VLGVFGGVGVNILGSEYKFISCSYFQRIKKGFHISEAFLFSWGVLN